MIKCQIPGSAIQKSEPTLLSPPDTARMLPVTDQLTCHTTSLNLCSTLEVHCELVPSFDHMMTLQSCKKSSGIIYSCMFPQWHVCFESPKWVAFQRQNLYKVTDTNLSNVYIVSLKITTKRNL